MSTFDPKSPSYTPPGNVVNTGDQFVVTEGNQTAETLLAAGTVLTESTAVNATNPACRGALFVLDATAFPASASTTIALKILFTDPVGGRTATIASRAAISASGQAVLLVYPSTFSASAGGVAAFLPRTFSAKLSISSAATNKSCHVSLSMTRLI